MSRDVGSKRASERRIAVDARPLCHPGTGIYRYTRELLTRMCRFGGEWFFYSPQHYDTQDFDLPNVHHCVAGVPPALRAGQLAQLFFPLWAKRDRVNVFWGPRHQLPMLPRNVRTAVTIHDLVWKDHGDTMRFPGRQIENFFTPRALARADVITVVSQFTRQRLQHYFPQYAHKVTVVPGASMLSGRADGGVSSRGVSGNTEPGKTEPGKTEPGAAVRGDYFLFVGTLEPRKNLPRLLRAYRYYVTHTPQALRLKIAGGTGWGGEDIAGLVGELGLASHVQLLGKVDDSAMPALYGGARALLMPSLYEGFGLPVVEALSVGVPVITSRDSAMSEVAGTAALYVDPRSESAIGDALVQISTDTSLYDLLRSRAVVEINRYDWDDSATTMAGLLLS